MEAKPLRIRKNIAEETFQIRVSDFGGKILRGDQRSERFGYFTAKGNNGILQFITYRIEVNDDLPSIHLHHSTERGKVDSLHFSQVDLAKIPSYFGLRPYLRCQHCGDNALVLYKPSGADQFLCRKKECGNITYASSNQSKALSGHIVQLERLHKLFGMRDEISKIFYRGMMTKKAKRYINWQNKWGMHGIDKEIAHYAEQQYIHARSKVLQNIQRELSSQSI
ncbi:hypothetical protein HYV44_03750 [Candidatus Microgenomates bacterium]|nr:hypothetical protein [Candidatus Microgenomates bacterium]